MSPFPLAQGLGDLDELLVHAFEQLGKGKGPIEVGYEKTLPGNGAFEGAVRQGPTHGAEIVSSAFLVQNLEVVTPVLAERNRSGFESLAPIGWSVRRNAKNLLGPVGVFSGVVEFEDALVVRIEPKPIGSVLGRREDAADFSPEVIPRVGRALGCSKVTGEIGPAGLELGVTGQAI